jgi:hypothetical protein
VAADQGRANVTESTRSLARRAGLLYVLGSSIAPFIYLYVPRKLLVDGDVLATVAHVRAGEGLLQAAILGELYGATLLVFVSLALYRLFKQVDQNTSMLMAAMMLVSVPISFVNTLSHLAPLLLIKNPAIASAIDPGAQAALVTFFLRLHNYGLVINQVFWGLWLFPIGSLVLRSGFLPRWLAYPLFAAGAGYVINSIGGLLPPSMRTITQFGQVLGIGEVPFTTYLLIWGVRGPAVDRIAMGLFLASVAISTPALVLLMGNRIDAGQYAVLTLASMVALAGMVLRWRLAESA